MLKLAKLPDRTPIKITISMNAVLDQDLQRYAVLYRNTYGETASVAELIPFMLDSFLESDRAFAKARKEGLPEMDRGTPANNVRAARTRKATSASPSVLPVSHPKEV